MRCAYAGLTMKLLLAAIGKAKASSPEQQIFNDYAKRLPWKIAVQECKDDAGLLAACKGYARIIALDESGKTLSSPEFAHQLKTWQQQGHSSYAVVIGGADGLSDELRKSAHLVWSFGRVTWPHMLVRALVAEQIYRAQTIISGHPYHRE
jgi:23S rRNA (pseudouridine1915-N3)-methyltransferase